MGRKAHKEDVKAITLTRTQQGGVVKIIEGLEMHMADEKKPCANTRQQTRTNTRQTVSQGRTLTSYHLTCIPNNA